MIRRLLDYIRAIQPQAVFYPPQLNIGSYHKVILWVPRRLNWDSLFYKNTLSSCKWFRKNNRKHNSVFWERRIKVGIRSRRILSCPLMVWKNPKSAGLLDLRKRDAIHHVIRHSRKKRAERRSCHWKRPLVITLISTFTWWIHTDSDLDLSQGLYIFLNFENVYNNFVLRCTTTT